MPYQPKYSQFIKDELKRLSLGNAAEQKRAKTIHDKISAVLLEPLNNIYKKTLPEDYCAIDVGERFRLFFKPIQPSGIVYFTWVNDENFLHTVGSKHDSYDEFRRKFNNGEIEAFTEEKIVKEEFKKNTNWGSSLIYVYFKRLTTNEEYFANSHIALNQLDNKQYEIRSISVTEEDKGLASQLLTHLTQDADKNGIKLYYYLILSTENLEKSRYLLQKFGFTLDLTEEDIELWIR